MFQRVMTIIHDGNHIISELLKNFCFSVIAKQARELLKTRAPLKQDWPCVISGLVTFIVFVLA